MAGEKSTPRQAARGAGHHPDRLQGGTAPATPPSVLGGASTRETASGRRGRNADATRERLVDAALDAFGLNGFDGASTRDIARRAGANLAAIPYHFGGKEGLHRAVAQHIVDKISANLGPLLDDMEAALEEGRLSPPLAARMLHQALDRAADTLLGRPEAARWARFVIREQMDPTGSFAVLLDGFMGRAYGTVAALYAAATGRDAAKPETLVRVFGLLGQLLVFRMARGLIEARLGWHAYGPEEVALVKDMLHAHLDALLAEARQ
jgi:TetR/AcrR family transcriptional regulator, regulator of cefoperazone and chloramphenicol sensitivity